MNSVLVLYEAVEESNKMYLVIILMNINNNINSVTVLPFKIFEL